MQKGTYRVDNGDGTYTDIAFETVAEQVFLKDGIDLQTHLDKKALLWRGSHYMNKGDVIILPKQLSDCMNGIKLVFSDYDPGMANHTGNNYNWYEKFVGKDGSFINSGNYLIEIPTGEDGGSTTKALYVKNDRIEGCSSKNVSDWNDVVLREIWEV